MAINLERLGKTIDKYMLDEVIIFRPSWQSFDPVTLEVIEEEEIFYTGKAFGSPMGDPQLTTIGERQVERTQYEIGIPRQAELLGVAKIMPNDIVRFTQTGSPALQGRNIVVDTTIEGTFFSHIRIKGWSDVIATTPGQL